MVKETPGFTSSVVASALHIKAIEAMKARGGNALGVESDESLNSRYALITAKMPLTMAVALLTLGWQNAIDDQAMNAYADRWLSRSKKAASDMGLLHPSLYINYAKHDQDPFSGYGEANKRRLLEIQKTVDPRGVFTSNGLCQGSFKIN